MTIDIATLADDANRLKVTWRKMLNFAASFAHQLEEQRKAFGDGSQFAHPGSAPWTFERWMLWKVGVREETAIKVLQLLQDRAVAEHKRRSREAQQRDQERLREIARRQKAERDSKKAAEHTARLARMAERDRKRAEQIELAAKRKSEPKVTAKMKALPPKPKAPPPILHAATNNGHAAPSDDALGRRAQRAYKKLVQSSDLWIEAAMELAFVLVEARDLWPNQVDFGDWLMRNGLVFRDADRAALISLGRLKKNQLRHLLQTTRYRSFENIWKEFQEDNPSSAARQNALTQARHSAA